MESEVKKDGLTRFNEMFGIAMHSLGANLSLLGLVVDDVTSDDDDCITLKIHPYVSQEKKEESQS